MTTTTSTGPIDDGHDAHGGHGHVAAGDHDGASHGTLRDYLIGFVLAVILTAIPFWLVMGRVIEGAGTTALVILALGSVQIVVHMVYFLHMNARSEGGWTLLALIFTLVLVVIALSGSLWIVYHLNHNMMPGMEMPMPAPR
ncbi:MAG: cytochrome o ubiquinol oxidase subunit IV [Lautropia sp.]